ncbi:MAG: hypothetical protein QM626_14100 [Microbacterium sp.]|uniref:hypothetical protein n=1 Tax=Microbacterium sp. TaxID=51671 RepID=UPI0039E6DFCD
MAEILHVWALAPAAIGTCCLAADGRRARARVPELVASALMLLAMVDAAGPGWVAPVYSAALLLLAAMALAALRGARRGRHRRRTRAELAMTVHAAVGLVVMAALMLGMGHASGVSGAHVHGPSAATVTVLFLAGGAAYALWSTWEAVRAHSALGRLQFGAMGATTLAMALAGVI